ncbi:MAG: Flp pilus assembly complex ATPase component TadA [Gammaproteobacteria bacterium]|nr:Flp pilus assembly complex ATPase component TadA [Gammaproteobacteria bacterium]NNL51535.1 Flp pilus assembly complex ATPase component TadA [Woeseiaceae bacterium]
MSNAAENSPATVTRVRMGVATHVTPKFSLVGNEALQDLVLVIDKCVDVGEFKIMIDFSSVQSIDSLALSTLMDLQDQLMKLGGWVKITGHNRMIAEIAAITGVSDYISFLDGDGHAERNNADDISFGPGSRLGDILVARNLISEERIAEALKLQDRLGKRMGRILIDKGWVEENDVLRALGEQLGVPFVRIRPGMFDSVVASTLDKNIARRLCVLPLFRVRSTLFLATAKPQDVPAFDEVSEYMQCEVRPVLARQADIEKVLSESLGLADMQFDLVGDVDEDFEVVENVHIEDYAAIDDVAAGSPVVNLVNSIIQRAVYDGASDIHLEPFRTHSRIRFRIDGLLYEFTAPRVELHPALVSRLKVMANLDIAERRMPQDGRIQVQTQGRSVDLRFSSLPGLYGEKVVLRILDKNQAILDVNKLNMSDNNLKVFKNLLDANHGLILVTGPTGSGKTTSLYAALNYLKSIEKNIVTIEDPVEYQLDIINQNEVRDGIGLTFAKILKHVLRQDPDIVMVGEIRERETAEIAVQAALTGHLVLSTLHTNDAVGSVTRLIDMGVEPYLLSSALLGVVGQRLVRTICPDCKYEFLAPGEIVAQYGWEDDIKLAKGKGCELCYDSGHKGRMGIHEVLKTDVGLQKLIISSPSRDELSDYLDKRRFHDLFRDGLGRVLDRTTTIEEVSRVTSI